MDLRALVVSFPLLATVAAADNGGLWEPLSSLEIPRQEIGAARIGNHVYVTGGLLSPPGIQATNTVEAYDISLDQWTFVEPMPVALDHMATVAHGGKLYVMGGYSGDFDARDEVWIYDPASDDWSPGAPIPDARGACWAVTFADRIYLFGGVDHQHVAQTSTFIYDPATNMWSQGKDMPTRREHLNAVALGDYIYVIGGRSGPATAVNERYDPALDEWETMKPMPTARSACAAAAFDGRIFMMGGEIPVLHSVNEAYDPETDEWTVLAPMPLPRHGVAAVTLDDRILLPAGGIVQGLLPTDMVDSFLPAPCPDVEVFCTAKTNSCGSLPAVSASGTPSASATSGFVVECAQTKAFRPGVLLYTEAGPATPPIPFQGGLLCIQPQPLRRTVPVLETSGSAGQCDGRLAIDMNAFAAGTLGGNPFPGLRIPGTRIHTQFWARDTIGNSLLSDGLAYTVSF